MINSLLNASLLCLPTLTVEWIGSAYRVVFTTIDNRDTVIELDNLNLNSYRFIDKTCNPIGIANIQDLLDYNILDVVVTNHTYMIVGFVLGDA